MTLPEPSPASAAAGASLPPTMSSTALAEVPRERSAVPVIGVLCGSGIGSEVIEATLDVLAALERATGLCCDVLRGGPIAEEAVLRYGTPLPPDALAFFEQVFAAGGAILNGPGGGRYVYELRRHFDLYCKLVPVRPCAALESAGCLAPAHTRGVDMLIIRDNAGGVYQGRWSSRTTLAGRVEEHSFEYSEAQVARIVAAAARAAAARRGKLHVVVKDGGVPGVSELWRDVSAPIARAHGLERVVINVDLAVYDLVRRPRLYDVLVAPNLYGDMLSDVAGLLVASRGVTYSGNYSGDGKAVYQTNHGCAHDLAGNDVANPGGQILSLAMLLRESCGRAREAALIERALASTWALGWRTPDIAESGCRVVGTAELAARVAAEVERLAAVERTDATHAAVH
jgi:3-isopropylmalate dehydrogenase